MRSHMVRLLEEELDHRIYLIGLGSRKGVQFHLLLVEIQHRLCRLFILSEPRAYCCRLPRSEHASKRMGKELHT